MEIGTEMTVIRADNAGDITPASTGYTTPQSDVGVGLAKGKGKGKGKKRIAVDMDDVLCETNKTIVGMHNEMFGTQPPLTLDDFQNYLYWRNRGWGRPDETVQMVGKLYANGLYMKAPPVPGAKEGLLQLKEMGYSLVIITARSESQREGTEEWIAKYLPDIFDEIHFTGAFQHLEATNEEKHGHVARKAIVSHQKRSKAEILHSTSAILLIDDSSENALDVSKATFPHPYPTKVLLFGNYPWNAIVHRPPPAPSPASTDTGTGEEKEKDPGVDTELDQMTYMEKEQKGLLGAYEIRRKELIDNAWLPAGVKRVADWKAVVEWVKEFESSQEAQA